MTHETDILNLKNSSIKNFPCSVTSVPGYNPVLGTRGLALASDSICDANATVCDYVLSKWVRMFNKLHKLIDHAGKKPYPHAAHAHSGMSCDGEALGQICRYYFSVVWHARAVSGQIFISIEI